MELFGLIFHFQGLRSFPVARSTADSGSVSGWAHQKLLWSCQFPAQKPVKISHFPQHHPYTSWLAFQRPPQNEINRTYSTFHLLIPPTFGHAEPPVPIMTSLPFTGLSPLPGMPFHDPCLLQLGPSCTFLVHLTDLFLFELLKHYKCLFYAL